MMRTYVIALALGIGWFTSCLSGIDYGNLGEPVVRKSMPVSPSPRYDMWFDDSGEYILINEVDWAINSRDTRNATYDYKDSHFIIVQLDKERLVLRPDLQRSIFSQFSKEKNFFDNNKITLYPTNDNQYAENWTLHSDGRYQWEVHFAKTGWLVGSSGFLWGKGDTIPQMSIWTSEDRQYVINCATGKILQELFLPQTRITLSNYIEGNWVYSAPARVQAYFKDSVIVVDAPIGIPRVGLSPDGKYLMGGSGEAFIWVMEIKDSEIILLNKIFMDRLDQLWTGGFYNYTPNRDLAFFSYHSVSRMQVTQRIKDILVDYRTQNKICELTTTQRFSNIGIQAIAVDDAKTKIAILANEELLIFDYPSEEAIRKYNEEDRAKYGYGT